MVRRKRLLEVMSHETISIPEVIRLVASEYGVTEPTVRRDINSMKQWLPKIINVTGDHEAILERILSGYWFAQQKLKGILEKADNDNARVGAARAFVEALDKEVLFRNKVGQFDLRIDKIEVIHSGGEISEAELARAIRVIQDLVMAEQAGIAQPDLPEEVSAESLDTEEDP